MQRDLARWKKHEMKTIILDAFATKQTVGIDHLVTQAWSHINDITNADKSWTAIHWMQSSHQHKNNKLRIPEEGYSFDELQNAIRNIWWFTGSLTKESSTGNCKCTCAIKWTSFSVSGLLAIRLTKMIEKISDDSVLRTIWENSTNTGDKARLSTHFLEALSDLLLITIHRMEVQSQQRVGSPTKI